MTRTCATSSRRGSIYVLVMGTAMLVTIVGVGALTVARISARTMSASSDWEEAGVLAVSATEQAISSINAAAAAPANWRTSYVSGAVAFQSSTGRKNFSWILIDEIDGNIANNYLDPIRLYGIGRVGSVTRVYSAVLYPVGTPLDVLRTACHVSGNINVSNVLSGGVGPVSTNATATVGGILNANLEAAAKSGGGAFNGTITVPSPPKTMPMARVCDDYIARATSVAASNFGNSKPAYLLSNTSNPFGATNPDGLYYVQIPSGQNIAFRNARIRGTVVVTGTSSQTVDVGPDVIWESQRADYPILIVRGVGTVNFNGSTALLSEATMGRNLNPPGTPYKGVENTTSTDVYPTELTGLVHVIGANTVNLNDKFFLRGCAILDAASVVCNNVAAITSDATLLTTPPLGYAKGDLMIIYPGSYKWDTTP